jgi:hypothetical protein
MNVINRKQQDSGEIYTARNFIICTRRRTLLCAGIHLSER